ncbi:hypothetical protein HY310_03795 [Candidatus Microgenomates bacterium]|nr:hypothetical protein [Candidatus Microgenomates bacterium]
MTEPSTHREKVDHLPEKILNPNSSVKMVLRGDSPVCISFFGLGGGDASYGGKNDDNTSAYHVTRLYVGQPNQSLLYTVFDTKPITAEEVNNYIRPTDFLNTTFVADFIASLAVAKAAIGDRKLPLTFESYSGGMFMAIMIASLANRDTNDNAKQFLKIVKSLASEITIFAPAMALSKYGTTSMGLINNLANTDNDITLNVGKLATLPQSISSSNTGHILNQTINQAFDGMLYRGRHLVLCEKVIDYYLKDAKPNFKTGEIPLIFEVHHKDDQHVRASVNMEILMGLPWVQPFELTETGWPDNHDWYSTAEKVSAVKQKLALPQ